MEDGRHYLDIFRTCSHSHQIKGRIKEEYEEHKEKWQELVCLFTAIMQAVSVTYTLQLCEVRAYFINKTTQKKMCGVLLSWTLILTCRLCTNDRCSGISEVRSCLIWKKTTTKKTIELQLKVALLSAERLCHTDIFHDLYKMSKLLSRLLINGPFSQCTQTAFLCHFETNKNIFSWV